MQRSQVVVPWREGLLLARAVRLAQMGLRFRSSVLLKGRHGFADLRSVLSVLALSATVGTALDVEASGVDELAAIQAVQQAFSAPYVSDAPDQAGPRRMPRVPQ